MASLNFQSLSFLKFSHAEVNQKLRWEHSKEFEYKGKMYDVFKSKNDKDSVFYWCWLDKEETKLNTQLKSVLTSLYQTDIPLNVNSNFLIEFYKISYLSCNFGFSIKSSYYYKLTSNWNYNKNYKLVLTKEKFNPPNLV